MSDRYQNLIRFQQEAIASSTIYYGLMEKVSTKPGAQDRNEARIVALQESGFDQAGNNLFDYLLNEFSNDPPCEVAHTKAQSVFKRTLTIDTMNAEELCQHEDAVVAIAVASSLIRDHRAPLYPPTIMLDAFSEKLKWAIGDKRV